MSIKNHYDAIIIGGGFYGCQIALKLKKLGLKRIAIFESEDGIMQRASLWNQARIHNGYHYPRALSTGLAASRFFNKFLEDYPEGIITGMDKIYAIARNSLVTSVQFERFCERIAAPIKYSPPKYRNLFDASTIEEVYTVQEYVFDAFHIKSTLERNLKKAKIDVYLNTPVKVESYSDKEVLIKTSEKTTKSPILFNCTYANLDQIGLSLKTHFRKEWAELAMVEAPKQLLNLGVTVMDGPFFSYMPFPPYKIHTLSHVRYTPICGWTKKEVKNKSINIKHGIGKPINASAMLRDAARYMPIMQKLKATQSFFEVKSILQQNEHNDSRPILFENPKNYPNITSVLGGKIDNVYDVLEKINHSLINKMLGSKEPSKEINNIKE
jgi:hypothetical protein